MALDPVAIAVNESVNQTVNQTAPVVFDGAKDYIFTVLWPRVHDLILAPFEHPEMLWTLAPMIIALILMQLYFGRNKDEALGWNTAFGNSVALIFISVSLLRGAFIASGSKDIGAFLESAFTFSEIKFIIIAAVFLYGIFLSTISFFHWIPEKLAFFMMNGISINVTAYAAIVLVNSTNIALDRHTLLSLFVIFIAVYAAAMLIRGFIPASAQSRIHLLERKRSILEKQEAHFHHKAMKAQSEWRKRMLEARSDRFEKRAQAVADDINRLKMTRIRH